MFQLSYRVKNVDDFTHQISQLGAQFVSKGPVQETYFSLEEKQLRLDQGMTSELLLITKHDHYQEFLDVNIPQHQQLRDMLTQALGEVGHFTKQVIRYHFKQVLLEIHRYEKLGDLLFMHAESLQKLKEIARQLGLEDVDRIEKTSLDLG